MVPAVLRRAFVGEHLVVADVVGAHAIDPVRHAYEQRKRAQVADEGGDRDVDNVVAEAASIGPAAGDRSAIAERILDLALEHIVAENAQTREASVVRVLGVGGPAARQARTPASRGPP